MTEAGKSKVNGFAVPELTVISAKLDELAKKVDKLQPSADQELVMRVFGLSYDQLKKLEEKLKVCKTVEEAQIAQSDALFEGMPHLRGMLNFDGAVTPMKMFTRKEKLLMAVLTAALIGGAGMATHRSGVKTGRKQVVDEKFDVAISQLRNGEPRVHMTMTPRIKTAA